MIALVLLVGQLDRPALAGDDKEVNAILDKAIKALGGEKQLIDFKAATWKSKGKMIFGGNENPMDAQITIEGLKRYRNEYVAEFNGNEVKGVNVLNGDKGWRAVGGNLMELDENGLVRTKRTLYLQMIPTTILPLKSEDFQVEKAGDEVLKITGPDKIEFKLYFDKKTGLPAKVVADVQGFQGEEVTQETTFSDYKDFDGIKKATKAVTSLDGETFHEEQVTEFRLLKKVDPERFAEPK
jgi:hypothetical protein